MVAEHLRDALRECADDWDQSAMFGRWNDGFPKGSALEKYATTFFLCHDAANGEILFHERGTHPSALVSRRQTTLDPVG